MLGFDFNFENKLKLIRFKSLYNYKYTVIQPNSE